MTKPTRKRWTKETYAEYLKTERWQTLRESKLHEVDHRCQFCNSADKLHVHHRCYDNLGQEGERRDLVVLCKECHQNHHFQTPEILDEETNPYAEAQKFGLSILEDIKRANAHPVPENEQVVWEYRRELARVTILILEAAYQFNLFTDKLIGGGFNG